MYKPHRVTVVSDWRANDTFEFDTQDEANDFLRKVNEGGGTGLTAIVSEGDITSANAELIDYRAWIK